MANSDVNDAFVMLNYALQKVGSSGRLTSVRTKISFNDLLKLARQPEQPENSHIFVQINISTEWTDDSPLTNLNTPIAST